MLDALVKQRVIYLFEAVSGGDDLAIEDGDELSKPEMPPLVGEGRADLLGNFFVSKQTLAPG